MKGRADQSQLTIPGAGLDHGRAIRPDAHRGSRPVPPEPPVTIATLPGVVSFMTGFL
jgi:hypothetical protein